MSKINPFPIVWDHICTLRRGENARISVLDVALFYGVPLAAVWAWCRLHWTISSDVSTITVTGLALLTGLLLNLLLLIHGLARVNERNERKLTKRGRQLLEEVYKNISYAILVAVFSLTVLIVEVGGWLVPAEESLEAGAVYLLIHFLLTLMMILKRIHVLMGEDFKER